MPRLTTAAFAELLQKGRPVPAVLLLGDEPYLRDECRAQLIDKYVVEAARTWALSRFSADRGEVQAAIDQAQTLPMLSPRQLVFLEDAEAIEKLAEKAREQVVQSLEAYLENPAPFTTLVIRGQGSLG
jgi:DNA polymerase-3 subunit delta